MLRVLVLSHNKTPLMPCYPARARELLEKKRAAVYRRYPFTIILNDRTDGATQPLTLKFDPGSKTTGIAMVAYDEQGKRVIWAAELAHRGQSIKDALTSDARPADPDETVRPATARRVLTTAAGKGTGSRLRSKAGWIT